MAPCCVNVKMTFNPISRHKFAKCAVLPLLASSQQFGVADAFAVRSAPPSGAATSLNPSALRLDHPIGNGTFGYVQWGRLNDERVVVKSSRPATDDPEAARRASSYLDTEAHLNRRLCLEGSRSSRHVAPYLGDVQVKEKGDDERTATTRYLIWRASGNSTLQDYLDVPVGGDDIGFSGTAALEALASSLGAPVPSVPHDLGREVLRQLMQGLTYIHSIGIVHRDIKPANVLVDDSTGSLRLIDFGSACDMGSWTNQRGYKGMNKGPRSILYCAPEEFVEEDHPYAFDVYSAAMCWLRLMLPGLRSSEDDLFNFRIAIRDHGHCFEEWHEAAALSGSLPAGWEEFFACPAHGVQAFRLIKNLLSFNPADRPSACEALLHPYLNPRCAEGLSPIPPARPWSLQSQLQRQKEAQRERRMVDECEVSDLYTQTVSIELPLPAGLSLKESSQGNAVVTDLAEGSPAARSVLVRAGDELVAIGPVDVEGAGLDHVAEILTKWPNPTALLQFIRHI